MSSRSRNRRNSRRPQGPVLSALKQIEENTRMELDKAPPSTRDKIPMQLSNKKIYTFKRSTTGPVINGSTSSSVFGASSYYLASFDSTSEIAENYQLYRIIEITVKFIPVAQFVNTFDSNTDDVTDFGQLHTVIDYRNETVPISIAELAEYKTHQVVRTGQYMARTWTPRSLGQAYAGVTPGYYCMPAGTWLSTDYNDINYYGIKWALSQQVGVATGSAMYHTSIDVVIQCKATL